MSVHAIYALEDLGYSRSYISSAYQWVIVCHAPDKGWWYGLCAEYVGTHKRDGGKVVRIVTVRQGRGTSLELRKGHYLRQFGGRWVTCDEGCYHADATAEILATDSTPEGMAAYHDYQLEMAN